MSNRITTTKTTPIVKAIPTRFSFGKILVPNRHPTIAITTRNGNNSIHMTFPFLRKCSKVRRIIKFNFSKVNALLKFTLKSKIDNYGKRKFSIVSQISACRSPYRPRFNRASYSVPARSFKTGVPSGSFEIFLHGEIPNFRVGVFRLRG